MRRSGVDDAHSTSAVTLVRIRTDTSLDQDCVLKATVRYVQRAWSCHC